MPLILPGNVASALGTGYDVDNSCRFNDGDSAYMQKTSSAGNRRTFTLSAWLKRGNLTYGYATFFSSDQAADNSFRVTFDDDDGSNDDRLMVYYYTGSHQLKFITNREFRDCSAWYHIVVAVDTTQSTNTNRVKIYVNGTQETSFSTATYPSQNLDTSVNQSGAPARVGAGTDLYFDGYMAEVCWIDGTQYAASDFGEFDSDSPQIWKPKDVSGLTFGTNGFYLDFKDSSNLGNDANGGTDLTETNVAAIDQSTDTPTNNFATWNPLFSASNLSYAEGAVEISCSADGWFESGATIGISTGKWYFELKCTLGSGTYSSESIKFGIKNSEDINDGSGEVTQNNGNHYQADGNSGNNSSLSGVGTFATYTTNDIIGCAVDMTNRKIYYHKNGTYINSGDPAAGSNGFDISSNFDFVLPTISMYESGTKGEVNFGNPSFSISSGNADADGYGNFEYSVPSGFYALCTKNLAEYG